MNNKNHKEVCNTLSILKNLKLGHISRAGSTICLGFGEKIEKNIACKMEDGSFGVKKVAVSKYALHIDCPFRIICREKILLSKNDIFTPNSTLINSVEDVEDFEWDVFGDNNFDEKIEKYFLENKAYLSVREIEVSRFGDLKIQLTDNFCIETFIDSSDDGECWRFFESGNNDAAHLITTGCGFYEDDEE